MERYHWDNFFVNTGSPFALEASHSCNTPPPQFFQNLLDHPAALFSFQWSAITSIFLQFEPQCMYCSMWISATCLHLSWPVHLLTKVELKKRECYSPPPLCPVTMMASADAAWHHIMSTGMVHCSEEYVEHTSSIVWVLRLRVPLITDDNNWLYLCIKVLFAFLCFWHQIFQHCNH